MTRARPGAPSGRTGHRAGPGWAGPGWAGLGRAGPGWAGLGRAGPGWAGLGRAGPGWAGLGHGLTGRPEPVGAAGVAAASSGNARAASRECPTGVAPEHPVRVRRPDGAAPAIRNTPIAASGNAPSASGAGAGRHRGAVDPLTAGPV